MVNDSDSDDDKDDHSQICSCVIMQNFYIVCQVNEIQLFMNVVSTLFRLWSSYELLQRDCDCESSWKIDRRRSNCEHQILPFSYVHYHDFVIISKKSSKFYSARATLMLQIDVLKAIFIMLDISCTGSDLMKSNTQVVLSWFYTNIYMFQIIFLPIP